MGQNNHVIGSEMSLIATDKIDISRYQNNAKLAVKGKQLSEAVLCLANITANPLYEDIKKSSEKLLKKVSFFKSYYSNLRRCRRKKTTTSNYKR